ncbi:unnamed protein product [Caretta caretta]
MVLSTWREPGSSKRRQQKRLRVPLNWTLNFMLPSGAAAMQHPTQFTPATTLRWQSPSKPSDHRPTLLLGLILPDDSVILKARNGKAKSTRKAREEIPLTAPPCPATCCSQRQALWNQNQVITETKKIPLLFPCPHKLQIKVTKPR